MRVLVTGLEGFTGHYLKSSLEVQGHIVIGLQCDLADSNAVALEVAEINPEAVVHLAGVAFVGHGDANAFYEVNLIGTRNLLAALAQYVPSVRSILLASSANVYGNQSEGVLSEESIPNPANDYAVSKYAMEQMARLWIDRLPLFVVRPFNYTGVGQDEKFLIPKIVTHFRKEKAVIELGNLEVWRDFGDVRSVSTAYTKLLEICPRGQTFNICTEKPHSLSEIISLCKKITGHNIDIKVNPEFIRANEVRVLTGSNSRLTKTIDDWKIYSLEETLHWMLQDNTVDIV